jgi:hypothetical protein
MKMAMHHGLASDLSTVDFYIETRHGSIRFVNDRTGFGKQSLGVWPSNSAPR